MDPAVTFPNLRPLRFGRRKQKGVHDVNGRPANSRGRRTLERSQLQIDFDNMTADQQSDVIKLQMAAKRTAKAATASAASAYHASALVTHEDLTALFATPTQDLVAAILAALRSGGAPLALNS